MILNMWYGILPSSYIKNNEVVGVRRLNMDLVIFRNEKGELGCLVNRCSHRGAALSLGKVKDNHVQCPFHGLEFDIDGKCELIPANGINSELDLSRYNVEKFEVREANDIIYLWYGQEPPENEELPFFYDFVDDSFVYIELEDHWNAHYSRAIENQLDVVHLPFVHHNTIGRGNKTIVNGPKVIYENGILTTSANNEVDEGQKPKPANDSVIKTTNLNFIFPNIWMNKISEKIKVIIYFAPVDDENTILFIRFYNKITGSKLLNRVIAFFGKYANLIIERQDRRIVVTQRPKASSLKGKEKLIPGDGPIISYRKIREELKNKAEGINEE